MHIWQDTMSSQTSHWRHFKNIKKVTNTNFFNIDFEKTTNVSQNVSFNFKQVVSPMPELELQNFNVSQNISFNFKQVVSPMPDLNQL